jgi:hypothetical protein
MLSIIFLVALAWVTWKFFVLGLKLTWGIAKIACTVLLFPLFMVCLVGVGLVYLAIPILIIAGIIIMLRSVVSV